MSQDTLPGAATPTGKPPTSPRDAANRTLTEALPNGQPALGENTEEILSDIGKDTVDFAQNYDTTAEEPTVLPAAVPNLLLNGSSGIAVGMATNIPPHNLTEIINALNAMVGEAKIAGEIDNPQVIYETTVEDLLEHIQGPDFPTAAQAYGHEEIAKAYATGKGSIVMRAKAEIVEEDG